MEILTILATALSLFATQTTTQPEPIIEPVEVVEYIEPKSDIKPQIQSVATPQVEVVDVVEETKQCAMGTCFTIDSFEIVETVNNYSGDALQWVECYNNVNFLSESVINSFGFTYEEYMNEDGSVSRSICNI